MSNPNLTSVEWRAAFAKQAPDARDRGITFGVRYAGKLGAGLLSRFDVEDLVADVLGELWAGDTNWNHERVGLVRAVEDMLRSRIPGALDRARAHVSIHMDPIDDTDARNLGRDGLLVDVPSRDPSELAIARDQLDHVLGALRERIEDEPTRRLLDALIEGIDPERLAEHLDMTRAELRNVRRRLTRLANELPRELHPARRSTAPGPAIRKRVATTSAAQDRPRSLASMDHDSCGEIRSSAIQ